MLHAVIAVGAGVLGSAEPPVPYPHPLVTELLYAVPPGDKGDASGDGIRDAVGDEFVELVNPHDRPIQLKGYTITDGTPADAIDAAKAGPAKPRSAAPKPASPPPGTDKPAGEREEADAAHKQVRFTFPALELKPGEVVVVFNGLRQKIAGPVGDAARAPAGPNEHFSGAYVFSMKNQSQYVAFSNTADCAIIWDPAGKPVEAIQWRHTVRAPKDAPGGTGAATPAKSDSKGGSGGGPKGGARGAPGEAGPGPASDRAVAPAGTLLVEQAPEGRGSVARVGLGRAWVIHEELAGAHGALFSPGRFHADGGASDDPPPAPRPK